MIGRGFFRYQPVDDVVIVAPEGDIETASDVVDWLAQCEAYLAPFHRKMDLVVIHDRFFVSERVGDLWGEARARVMQRFARHSVRVNSNPTVRRLVINSGARYGVATLEAASMDAAIAKIKELRRDQSSKKLARVG